MKAIEGTSAALVSDLARGHRRRRARRPTQPARVGDQLGNYRLCLEIGRGGMATVYLAQAAGRAGLHRFVALKCIRPELALNPKFVDMFFDEAQIASGIQHANVCSVLDFDEHDGVYYLAMEYLSGQPLTKIASQLEAEPDRWPAASRAALVARILEGACEGLHAAHELRNERGELRHVVHRDVSPDNLFVTYDGTVKVVDFGIAYATEQHHKTVTGMLKGKCSYLAPELLAGDKPDRRTDVWGLGLVAWELLTGRKLFDQGSDVAILQAIGGDMEIPRPSAVRDGLPPLLDEIVLRALQRNPARRYQTAREMGRILNRFLVEERAVVGTAEVADFMRSLFPAGPACARQLLGVAEQLEEFTEIMAPGVFVAAAADADGDDAADDDAAAAPAPRGSRLHVPTDLVRRAAAAVQPRWPRRRTLLACTAAASVLLVACSAFLGLRSSEPTAHAAARDGVDRRPPQAPLPPEAGGVALAPAPPALPGYTLEASPIGSDATGGVLLRLRVVADPRP